MNLTVESSFAFPEMDQPKIQIGDVNLWLARHDLVEAKLSNVQFTDEEMLASNRLKRVEDRLAFLSRRWLVKRKISEFLQCERDEISVAHHPSGRPFLRCSGLPLPCGFSLSSCGGVTAIALTRQSHVGVDLQAVDGNEDPHLLLRTLSTSELRDLSSRPGDTMPAAWAAYWTRKEACLKAIGAGLRVETSSILLPSLPLKWEGVVQQFTVVPGCRGGWIVSLPVNDRQVISICAQPVGGSTRGAADLFDT